MKIDFKSRITNGRKCRPFNSPLFSAAWGRALGLAVLMLSAVPSFAGAKPVLNNDAPTAKFSADLHQRVDANGMVTVIVQHRLMPSNTHLKGMQGRGATIKSKFHTIRAVTMRVPISMLAELANDPNVAYITPDRTQKMTANPTTEEFATAVEADIAASQYAFDGTGVGVALIDSGIAVHPDLNNASGVSRVVYSQSFVAGDSTTSDAYGHGTHVAGRSEERRVGKECR